MIAQNRYVQTRFVSLVMPLSSIFFFVDCLGILKEKKKVILFASNDFRLITRQDRP